jgi:putative helicase MOV10L1
MFYDGTVESHAPKANTELPVNWETFSRGAGNGRASRFLFYGVKGRQRREGNTSSWTNPIEAVELVDLLEKLLDSTTLTPADVAVMATYRRQVVLIRIALRERALGAIRVGTVDDFQGQEEKIIFISTVVTRPTTLDALDSEIGFLNNPKRFNVAISRAMALNVIVGHPLVLLQNALWAELVRECVRRDAYRGAGAEYLPRFAGGGDDFDLPSSLHDDDHNTSQNHADAIASAVAAVAELSLLGAGARDAMTSQDAEHAWVDWGDEPSWRVAV